MGGSVVSAQITTPEIPDLPGLTPPSGEAPDIPQGGVPTVAIPGVDLFDDGVTVGDMSVTTGEDGSTVISAGDLLVSSEIVDGEEVYRLDVPWEDGVLLCKLTLAEGVTLDEFLTALDEGSLVPSDTPDAVAPDDPLGSLPIETELGTLNCSAPE